MIKLNLLAIKQIRSGSGGGGGGGDSWVAIPQMLIVPTYNMQYYCSAWCANALKDVTIVIYS